MDEKDCNKVYNKGVNKLKTSFFSFKFSPDYLGAVDEFTSAAKGYRKLGLSNKSIASYQKAIECYHNLNDFWAEGNCNLGIAEIYLFDLKNSEKGIEFLKKANYCYQVSGKFSYGIKSIVTVAEKFMENKDYETAEKILKEAFNICAENTEDKLIGGTFEQIFNKLLDVECGMMKWAESINLAQKYVEAQLKYPEKDNYRINKTYMKLCILRIINGEDYLCDDIFLKMFNSRYEDTSTDIGDIKKLMDSIKNLDKKNFTYCVSSAFTLFENNLLKGLQALYKNKEEEAKNAGKNENVINNVDDNTINTNSNNNNNIINNNDEFL
jgi:tetratricopeptide (TPR) repeat protein